MSKFAEGSVALVTGAAGGIGIAIVRRLVSEGVTVAVSDRDADALKAVTDGLPDGPQPLEIISGDITDPGFRAELVAGTVESLGRLDVLINNAGIMAGGPPESITDDAWNNVHEINSKAPFFLAQEALPHLSKSGGAIVNQSSVLGIRGGPALAAYASSKAAVIGMTLALAVDLAPAGVRVNALCPGTIDTAMPHAYAASVLGEGEEAAAQAAEIFVAKHLIKRLGTPDEVAAAAVFLASQEASFITGVALPVDGGWSVW